MNAVKIMIALCVTLTSAVADTGFYPLGVTPPVKMSTALTVFERHAKKYTGFNFDPRKADLMGGPNNYGSWTFTQYKKDGSSIRYVYYFEKDLCLILDASLLDEVFASFKRDGSPVDFARKSKADQHSGEPDPFAE